MKQLTKQAVQLVMDLLITTNGGTSTLEVKTHLRDLGYRADQKEVSDLMAEIQLSNPDTFTFTANGDYRTYTYIMDSPTEYDNEYETLFEVNEDEAEDESLFQDNADEVEDIWDFDDDWDEDEDEDDILVSIEVTANGIFDEFLSDEETATINDFNSSMSAKSRVDQFNSVLDDNYKTTGTSDAKPVNIGQYYSISDALNSAEVIFDENTWIVTVKDVKNPAYLTFKSDLTSDKVRSRYASILKYKIQNVRARRARNYDF